MHGFRVNGDVDLTVLRKCSWYEATAIGSFFMSHQEFDSGVPENFKRFRYDIPQTDVEDAQRAAHVDAVLCRLGKRRVAVLSVAA